MNLTTGRKKTEQISLIIKECCRGGEGRLFTDDLIFFLLQHSLLVYLLGGMFICSPTKTVGEKLMLKFGRAKRRRVLRSVTSLILGACTSIFSFLTPTSFPVRSYYQPAGAAEA
ncbi:hypothetical protein HD806DRAFT_475694 [Xylariaceae sp. AK1471]|nr:hypothetical protein HD806DRAFT_475694 [Xylariaceae sp. AK1471]